MSRFQKMPVPYVIERLHDGAEIRIQWEEQGHVAIYPARLLRLACGCAACVEEVSGEPILDPETVPEDVHAQRVRLVGQYAAHFVWSDGHSTGIYPFDRLIAICPCDACATARAIAGDEG